MVPVEYSAGRAAFISKHKSEWAPDKHADKVANVKCDADKEKVLILNNLKMLKHTKSRNKCCPKCHNLARRLIGVYHILFKLIPIEELMQGGAEFFFEKFL